MLGNFTCRQCRRTGRGENGYGTCHQNRPAKWRCGGRYEPDGSTAAQSLILCSRQPAPDSLAFRCASPIQWWCRLAARKFTTVLTHWPLPRREKATGILTFDMATTVQAWRKVPDARSRNMCIPDTWAVDKNGAPTTDPLAVHALLPAAGPKGSGLMMMIDVLSGVLLGLPFGRQVSSMYDDLHAGRNFGHPYSY